jgi:SAM-dependent methyltransferase
MLEEAVQGLGPVPPGTTVDPRQGELERLPLEDEELDGLVCGLVLHHLDDLSAPAAEMRRVLRPGGSAVIVELAPHREAWMHEALGDRHLGLDPRDVVRTLERAGLVELRLEAVADRYRPRRPDAPDEAGADLSLYAVRARSPGGR